VRTPSEQDRRHVDGDLRGSGGTPGQPTSEADKGSTLEQLVLSPCVRTRSTPTSFSEVWLWQEWPGLGGEHDTGIDVVAVDRLTGDNVAIQCTFYAPGWTIGKQDIDSFLSAAGKDGFAERIIVSTTHHLNGHAEDAIQRRQSQVRRIRNYDAPPDEIRARLPLERVWILHDE
jgi:predicted helicase